VNEDPFLLIVANTIDPSLQIVSHSRNPFLQIVSNTRYPFLQIASKMFLMAQSQFARGGYRHSELGHVLSARITYP
jgi:hypothetical protein